MKGFYKVTGYNEKGENAVAWVYARNDGQACRWGVATEDLVAEIDWEYLGNDDLAMQEVNMDKLLVVA